MTTCTCKRCRRAGEWYSNDGQAGPYEYYPVPDPLNDYEAYKKWHEKHMEQLNKMSVTVVPSINDELLEALNAVREIGLNDNANQDEFDRTCTV